LGDFWGKSENQKIEFAAAVRFNIGYDVAQHSINSRISSISFPLSLFCLTEKPNRSSEIRRTVADEFGKFSLSPPYIARKDANKQRSRTSLEEF
jgi:hypothetical protein